jgi:hypothetical protein
MHWVIEIGAFWEKKCCFHVSALSWLAKHAKCRHGGNLAIECLFFLIDVAMARFMSPGRE